MSAADKVEEYCDRFTFKPSISRRAKSLPSRDAKTRDAELFRDAGMKEEMLRHRRLLEEEEALEGTSTVHSSVGGGYAPGKGPKKSLFSPRTASSDETGNVGRRTLNRVRGSSV